MYLIYNIITLFTCLTLSVASNQKRPVIKTNYGMIRGHVMTSYSGREFFAFNGIPYSKPPVGELRFRPPVSPSKYDGILDASIDGPDCYQISMKFNYNQYTTESVYNGSQKYVGEEDCLYLNVFTPRLNGDKLPVMVFIHGGAFKIGSGATELQGPQFFLDNDIILVTINYRLEILGFLRADDTHLPGNLGLKDQSAALRWIKENINHFNGDPESITIFGESAGGASVNFQMLAPRNKGLFQRAISQSGFIDCPWPINSLTKSKQLAETLAITLGCPREPQAMLKCLQDKSVLEIYQAFSTMESDLPYYMDFKPVIENEVPGAFITRRSLEEGSDIPWIIGVTSGEGIMFLEERFLVGDNDLSELNQSYDELLPKIFYLSENPRSKEVVDNIKQFYLGDKSFTMDNVQPIVDLFSDAMFNYGFYKAGEKHKGKLYRYLFSHLGERSFSDSLRHLNLGVNHGDELHLQFYSTHYFISAELNEADSIVSRQLLKLWTNFAKYGDPTPEGSAIKWPESSGGNQYLEMSTDGLKIGSDLFKERLEFWKQLDNQQIKRDEL